MYSTSSILIILSLLTSLTLSTPFSNDQLQFSSDSSSVASSKSKKIISLFACPTWKVRCVQDSKGWPSGIVGDIGPKPFCFSGLRCNQCDFEANTIECNETFSECENECTAFAPIPF